MNRRRKRGLVFLALFFVVRLSHRLRIRGVPKCERIFSISFVETRKVRCSKSVKFPVFQIHFGESHLLTALMENDRLAQSHVQKQKCFPRPQFQLIMLYFQRLFPAGAGSALFAPCGLPIASFVRWCCGEGNPPSISC